MNIRILTTSVILLSSFAAAQTTVHIGEDAVGCTEGGALLSDGSSASAKVTFDYDQATALLSVTVLNTTPVTPGVPSPTITRVYFNAPTGSLTGAALVSQTSTGGTQPNFVFGFDADAGDGQDPNRAGCLGTFNFRLASSGIKDGIGNAEADVVCSDSKDPPVLGAATFTFQLTGPDVANLRSDVFAAASSWNPLLKSVNVAAKFDGASCEGSGTLGNGDVCRQAVFLRGRPELGQFVQLIVEGGNQCRSWLGVSDTEGPADFKMFVLPIGVPVLFTYDFGYFAPNSHEFALPLIIPFAPELIGQSFFSTSLHHPFLQIGPFGFADAYGFTITGGEEQIPR